MHRRSVLTLALSSLAAVGLATQGALAEDAYRLSGPHVHGNLAIYFVHGKSAPGPVPLTLQEAVAKGSVRVHETGNVNELQIENLSSQEVFVQSGDIVKGGKQDRVLMVSLVLPPKSGRIPIASFCVEQGRWSARTGEDVSRFSSADSALPSRKAKMAMKAPIRTAAPADARTQTGQQDDTARVRTRIAPFAQGTVGEPVQRGGRSETSLRQAAVWADVAKTQTALSSNVGQSVSAPQSASSLQLSLENEKLKEMQAAYMKALEAEGQNGDDVIGYVFTINGRINSGDVYPSNGLFRKMWPKLLKASVTEAIGERNGAAEQLPSHETVLAFLQSAERGGEATQRELTKSVRLETRDGEKAVYFATERASGGWVHRNYLAK
jgi:hypothetical protein